MFEEKWKQLLRKRESTEVGESSGIESTYASQSETVRLWKTRVRFYYSEFLRRLRAVDPFRRQEVYSLSLIAVILGAGLFALLFYEANPENASARTKERREEEQRAVIASPFEDVRVTAKSAYVWDVREGRALFEKNALKVVPLASLTKVVMALTAADLLPRTTVIRIHPEFLAEEGDAGLYADENWRFKDLLEYSLIVSSNDGANAIASVAGSAVSGVPLEMGRSEFVSKMNQKAHEIGLTSTYFNNETGLDLTAGGRDVSGGYGSARDMALLFEYALEHYPDILEATKYGRIQVTSLDNIRHSGWNTNQDVNKIPGIIASKTGYTELSGGNLVVVLNAGVNRPIVISVLGSTFEGRFEDVQVLAKAALDHLAREGDGTVQASNQ